MYREKLWTMRTYTGFRTPRVTNEWNRRLLAEEGVTGLSVALDLPTQMGYDSDHPEWRPEVGRVGVAIDSLADFEVLFDGIPLDQVSTSFTINAPAFLFLALYQVAGERQGVAPAVLRPIVQNDILKEFFARGACVFPVEPSLRLVADTFEYCSGAMPRANPISVCGYHIREAGCTPAQEMAYGLLIVGAYTDLLVRRGLDVDEFAPRLSFNFTAWGRLFEEVAKFRAGRRLYARMMKERFGAKNPKSMMFRSLIGGGGSGFTVQEPENNIVRGAYFALAAALSGAQTMALPTYDEAYTIPSPKAQLLALRTMQICAEETGVADTVDPLAGSYFVEALTDQMEAKIREEMAKVERMGGVVEAVKSGAIQAEVARQAYRFEQLLLSGEYPKVGVNRHVAPDAARESTLELYAFDPNVAEAQVTKLARLRRGRDAGAVARALDRLRDEARGTENLMPAILEAVRHYATLGEMAGALREVWGEHKEPLVF